MSQWGEEKLFAKGSTKIRVIPDVKTDSFAPICVAKDLIDGVFVLDIDGPRDEIYWQEIRTYWRNRPYLEWVSTE